MKERNILFEILLSFFQDPPFEVQKIKGMRVENILGSEPFHEIWKVLPNFLTVEDTIDHVAAEEAYFDFVAQMGIDLLVLVNALKYV